MFIIRMGIPEMRDYWDSLEKKANDGSANKNEIKQYKKLGKAFYHLSIDLKIGEIEHKDIGQMNTYLNYIKKEVSTEGDNPPVGLILGAYKDELLMEYATQGIENNLFVSKYQLYLPNREELQRQLECLLEENEENIQE